MDNGVLSSKLVSSEKLNLLKVILVVTVFRKQWIHRVVYHSRWLECNYRYHLHSSSHFLASYRVSHRSYSLDASCGCGKFMTNHLSSVSSNWCEFTIVSWYWMWRENIWYWRACHTLISSYFTLFYFFSSWYQSSWNHFLLFIHSVLSLPFLIWIQFGLVQSVLKYLLPKPCMNILYHSLLEWTSI